MLTPTWRIHDGDCRTVLTTLPERSVQTCVTSPPYFGLRDYGHADQIGLEPTPDEFVGALVAVFREVRRVLRDDGTVWLNLASSYASSGTRPSQSRPPERVPAYGTDGTAPPDCPVSGSACLDLCDGCRAAIQSHHGRSGGTGRPLELAGQLDGQTGRDTARWGFGSASPDASPLDAQASTTPRSSRRHLVECSHCSNCGVCLSVLRSSSRDARLCARMAANTNGSGEPASDGRNQGMDAGGMAWLNYTSRLKAKDLIPTPWMLAMALQYDGWYLRMDNIWSKLNPMPESVTDRPTSAHEYLFLLSKSGSTLFWTHRDHGRVDEQPAPDYRWVHPETGEERADPQPAPWRRVNLWRGHDYVYDADAIAEDAAYPGGPGNVRPCKGAGEGDPFMRTREGIHKIGPREKRNKRSVWTVATQPYPGAHFAVFPPKLIEPCILAGSKPGDTVLDPFAGAGTTGLVALRRGRSFVGIELNPGYAEQARNRIRDDAPLFNVPAEAAELAA